MWLERFSAVSQPFLSRISAVFSRFSAKNAWLHTVSMGNGDFELFLHVLGPSNAIDSKFCVVTASSDSPRLFATLIRSFLVHTTSGFTLVGALGRFSGVSQAFGPFSKGIDSMHV